MGFIVQMASSGIEVVCGQTNDYTTAQIESTRNQSTRVNELIELSYLFLRIGLYIYAES